MLFLLAKISVIIIFLSYMLCSLPIAPFVYSLIPKFIYLLWRNVFQIAIYYFHFFFCIMLRSDYIPKIIKIDQVLHPFFYLMQYYIISYFLKKITFINTEVEIAGSEEPNRLLCKTKRGRKLRPHRSHIIPELRPDPLYHFLPCSGVLQVLLGKILLSGMLSFQTSHMGCHCLWNTPCQVRSNHIQAPL